MAFLKKPSLAVVLVVLMLLVTQPVLSFRFHRPPGQPRPPRETCKVTCYLKCLFDPDALKCVGRCLFGRCHGKKKSSNDLSARCGFDCIRSRCSNPGSGKVSVKCATSCVNGCDATFGSELY